MNILLVNKFYYLKGGTEKYFFGLEDLLSQKGHNVSILSSRSSLNNISPNPQYLGSYDNISALNFAQKLNYLPAYFYNNNIFNLTKKAVKDNHIDIAHLNNINYQLSTSVIDALKRRCVPMVMTLHDYQLISPNYTLYNPNHDCATASKNKKFYQCLWHNCYQNSLTKSLIAVPESYFNHLRGVYDKIDAFIAPSRFLADQFIKFGYDKSKIYFLPNFLSPEDFLKTDEINVKENYYLYLGRITKEKGILNIIDIFNKLKLKLKIIGEDEKNLLKKIDASEYINYLGKLDHELAKNYLKKAKGLIMPSIWPENCPYSALEALAVGTPVIAKRIGGLPEIVKSAYNGQLFDNYHELTDIIKQFEKLSQSRKNKIFTQTMESAKKYQSEIYYQKLKLIYKSVATSTSNTLSSKNG